MIALIIFTKQVQQLQPNWCPHHYICKYIRFIKKNITNVKKEIQMTKQGSLVGQLTRMDLSSISYPHLPPMSGDQNKCWYGRIDNWETRIKTVGWWTNNIFEIWKSRKLRKSRNLGTEQVALGWWTNKTFGNLEIKKSRHSGIGLVDK